ncbi:ABC transporter permease [Lacisediminihabitans changchengi]|uniref:ABC transporter permease n=1 Tax=Lacisediminihabitans changchengi TaxID=2787634 RepID=A0A934W5R6_9MICO|nr:ABC transporter permease [Lacisediminihabitans changchengi]MBK4348825.1 ABC transporter permease [Lacisediminihabitans changchengi]
MSSNTMADPHPVTSRARVARWGSPTLLYVPALVVLVPVFLIPTALLLSASFVSSSGPFGNFATILDSQIIKVVFLRSFAVAAIVTAISLVIGLPFASVALKAGPRLRNILLGSIAASLFFSVIVRSYAWLALLGHNGPVVGLLGVFGVNTSSLSLSKTPFAVAIGLVQYGVPFMVLAISDVMRRVDGNIDRAAATLGAGAVTRWVRVTLPLIAPGIIAGVTIVFTTTLGYFLIPSILGSPKEAMIGQLISQQVGTTVNWGLGAAISTALLVVSLLLVLILQRLGKRIGRQ